MGRYFYKAKNSIVIYLNLIRIGFLSSHLSQFTRATTHSNILTHKIFFAKKYAAFLSWKKNLLKEIYLFLGKKIDVVVVYIQFCRKLSSRSIAVAVTVLHRDFFV